MGADLQAASSAPLVGQQVQDKAPKPPMDPSSTMMRASCSRASRGSGPSSGLAKRASATVVERPRPARSSAAFSDSAGACRATGSRSREPSRTMRPLPISSGAPRSGHLDADAFAARIAAARSGRSSIATARSRPCGPAPPRPAAAMIDEVGQAAEIGDVERARVGRAVGADQAGAVDGEAHRQVLDRDVVHDLVVGALQEGRIDRAERLYAFGRQARGEGHRVLLGDADVEGALRESSRRRGPGPCPKAWPAVMATIRSSRSARDQFLPKTLV